MKNDEHPLLIIIEPSDLVYEGLCALVKQHAIQARVMRLHDPEELESLNERPEKQLVVMNPSLTINRLKWFLYLVQQKSGTKWFALVYCHFSKEVLHHFHGVIDIASPGHEIASQLAEGLADSTEKDHPPEHLSEREKEVLLLLVQGLQNKEIAERLHISIHTVISHRKNIAQKTGIRSQAGLVIYAISNKLIPIESLGM